jgi:hypothetical protein
MLSKKPSDINSNIFFFKFSGVSPLDNVLHPRTGATIAAINAFKDKSETNEQISN